MDNLLRILDRFPESLDVLPGVLHQQAVVTRKCKMADVGMVFADCEEYREKKVGDGDWCFCCITITGEVKYIRFSQRTREETKRAHGVTDRG
jgi:hypothetical protein